MIVLKTGKFQPEHTYLKYWRTVEYYTRHRHGLSSADLSLLIFIYDEPYFTKTSFREFAQYVKWNERRFDDLVRDGWIRVWRKKNKKWVPKYELSKKGKLMVQQIYKVLNGEEEVPSSKVNPLFKKNVPYMHKIHRRFIKRMNEAIKQRKYPAPE